MWVNAEDGGDRARAMNRAAVFCSGRGNCAAARRLPRAGDIAAARTAVAGDEPAGTTSPAWQFQHNLKRRSRPRSMQGDNDNIGAAAVGQRGLPHRAAQHRRVQSIIESARCSRRPSMLVSVTSSSSAGSSNASVRAQVPIVVPDDGQRTAAAWPPGDPHARPHVEQHAALPRRRARRRFARRYKASFIATRTASVMSSWAAPLSSRRSEPATRGDVGSAAGGRVVLRLVQMPHHRLQGPTARAGPGASELASVVLQVLPATRRPCGEGISTGAGLGSHQDPCLSVARWIAHEALREVGLVGRRRRSTALPDIQQLPGMAWERAASSRCGAPSKIMPPPTHSSRPATAAGPRATHKCSSQSQISHSKSRACPA